MQDKKTITKILMLIPIVLFALMCILPFVAIVSASISNSSRIAEEGVSLLPRDFDFAAYRLAFRFPEDLLRAYGVSVIVTASGTALNLVLSIPLAYALSKREFTFGRSISLYIFITVIFSGGLIPLIILFRDYLRIYDTIWVLILPNLVMVPYVMMLKTFFYSVPDSLYESAKIDGASEYLIMLKIAVPLIKPGIATVAFYSVLAYWNDAYSPMVYIETNTMLTPIALYLTRVVNYVEFLKQVAAGAFPGLDLSGMNVPDQTMIFAVAVVTTAPMLFVFTYFQKYFVRGLTAGGVKG